MATDSFRKVMSDDRVTIATDPIDVAWKRLQTSEAYWAGYSGMLIGGLIYSLLLSLFMTVITYGLVGVMIILGGTVGFTGLIGVIGALIFLVVRAINASLDWPLTSRYAATTAACLTGIFIAFVPMTAARAFENGIGFAFVFCGPVMLIAILQAGAWLAADRELRKFEQRVAFSASDKVVVKKKYRVGIGTLMICTLWLAGSLAIFGAADRLGFFGKSKIELIVAICFCVFLAAGFSTIFVVMVKSLRGLQKKLFYRKTSVVMQPQG